MSEIILTQDQDSQGNIVHTETEASVVNYKDGNVEDNLDELNSREEIFTTPTDVTKAGIYFDGSDTLDSTENNDVVSRIKGYVNEQVGDKSQLPTVNKDNIVESIKEVNTSLSELANDIYTTVEAIGINDYIGNTTRIKSLEKGTKFTLFITNDATANCTLNLNSYGVKSIKDSFGDTVINMKANIPYNICYNGTDFILQGKGGDGELPRSIKDSTKKGVSTSQIIILPFTPRLIMCKNYNASNYTFISQNTINFFGNKTNASNTIMIASENSITLSQNNVIWDGVNTLTITHFTTNPVEYFDYWAFE